MTDVVTAFCRHRDEILLVRRGDAVGSYRGQWGAVSGYVEAETSDPVEDARRELREEVGVKDATLVRAGAPLEIVDEEADREWTVYPCLFDVADRTVDLNWELVDAAWVEPGAMFDRDCVPRLWEAYRRVGPTVETVETDETSGSAAISVTALEALRDAASEAAHADSVDSPAVADWDGVVEVARRLRDARPSMVVVANRVNRVLSKSDGAQAVAERAHDAIGTALGADGQAASEAATLLGHLNADPPTVCTISRSGTVLTALRETDARVYVGESRTGNEGVAVAEELARVGHDVTLTTDAALASIVAGMVGPKPDAVLVGADAVLPDGSVVNKVGTRSLGLACVREGVPLYVVASRDKVAGDAVPWGEAAESAALYDGDAPLDVENPVFDLTPAVCVDGVVTETGVLDESGVDAVAADHRANAAWDTE
jgi:translation initiation factor 2B subunit (eIF-2B alpha/beta/delta family)/8-oxo-dGTP pyrophosphatase MutT (NUDIX family)